MGQEAPLQRGVGPAHPTEQLAIRRLAAGFSILAGFAYALIILGALVRAHGAGLACPDWPLCFGQWVPGFDLKVAFEWSHRVLAGGVALIFIALTATALRRPLAREAVGKWLLGTGGLLFVQIILGALTVWQLLASWTVTSHLLVGNAFAVSLAIAARGLFDAAGASRPVAAPSRAAVAMMATGFALLWIQMTLGGLTSSQYAGLACPEWPTCANGVWFPSFDGARGIHLLHRLGAYALLAATLGAAFATRGIPRVGRLAATALVLTLGQVAVGVANVLFRLPVEITGLHSALAAALVLCWTLALRELVIGLRRDARDPVLQQRPLAG